MKRVVEPTKSQQAIALVRERLSGLAFDAVILALLGLFGPEAVNQFVRRFEYGSWVSVSLGEKNNNMLKFGPEDLPLSATANSEVRLIAYGYYRRFPQQRFLQRLKLWDRQGSGDWVPIKGIDIRDKQSDAWGWTCELKPTQWHDGTMARKNAAERVRTHSTRPAMGYVMLYAYYKVRYRRREVPYWSERYTFDMEDAR